MAVVEQVDPRSIAHLAEKAQGLKRYVRSDNTQKSYGSQWRRWEAFCAFNEVSAYCNEDRVLLLYLVYLCEECGLKPATMKVALASVRHFWKERFGSGSRGYEDSIRETVAALTKKYGAKQVQKDTFTREQIGELSEGFGDRPLGARNRALLLIGVASTI